MVRIVFTASGAWLARLIRWATKGRVSHVFIQHPSTMWGGEWATEATWPMVLQRPAEKSRRNVAAEFECLFDASTALRTIRDEVGKWYSFDGLFLFGWFLLVWRIFRHKIRHPLRSTSGDLCSELVGKMLKAAPALPYTSTFDVDYLAPETLLVYCENNPGHFRKL